ncbi:MAG: AAA family ATPase [Chthonomonadaceae bacterium]|nr:AAA family ATPase [Chthonomonadaceae bacterium]
MTDSLTLSSEQKDHLQSLKALWEENEGEERFAALRLREQDVETLRLIKAMLEGRGVWSYDVTRRFLSLVRALASNPNLDVRLLRSPGEPTQFQAQLRELLYGASPLPARLKEFISRRHAGGRTALQLLCVSDPHEFPLITSGGWKSLKPTGEQERIALEIVSRRHFPDLEGQFSDDALQTLAQAEIYRLALGETEVEDYLALHRLLTWEGSAKRSRRQTVYAPLPQTTGTVQESTPLYRSSETSVRAEVVPVQSGDFAKISTQQVLSEIEAEIALRGFTYAPLTIRSYFIALQSKPFALLSGLSGTGKTRLTSLLAEALTGNTEQYLNLPVRPDWNDSTPILGYVNYLAGGGTGRYVATPFLNFLARALENDANRAAYFLCLDEMNLARVEYYFAEILSAMETEKGELLLSNGQAMSLPPNLFFSGTLNLDESTHSLSRKTLDRANLLSFASVDLRDNATPSQLPSVISHELRQAVFLGAKVKSVAQARARLGGIGGKRLDGEKIVIERLSEVNAILERGETGFGYRVRDEVLKFCANSFDRDGSGLLVPNAPTDAKANLFAAFDLQLMQKVLPRLSGTREQIEASLVDMLLWTSSNDAPRTAERLQRLKFRLDRDGFLIMD